MFKKRAFFCFIVVIFFIGNSCPWAAAGNINNPNAVQNGNEIINTQYKITWAEKDLTQLTYSLNSGKNLQLNLPQFEIDGKVLPTVLKELKSISTPKVLANKVTEYTYAGEFKTYPGLRLQLTFQVSPDNPVLRFRYSLLDKKNRKLTKTASDQLTYLSFTTAVPQAKEVRFSEFNERFHATHLTEYNVDERHFANNYTFMGPLMVWPEQDHHFLVAYEHGSQFPDRFLQFALNPNKQVQLQAVKGNYLHNQLANTFTSVWLEVAGSTGSEDQLAQQYRGFMLQYITQNTASRQPYIFYNTWGRQERSQWAGNKYLSTMALDFTLQEIDRAHAMGVEVFVIDTGWYLKTGDWEVNKKLFPDELKKVKARLDSYGMKLGLWFNPTVAAVSSKMLAKNPINRSSWDGKLGEARPIWETEESVNICLVSPYWQDFAAELVRLVKETGVSYFKWDAVGQYGCNAPNHEHGTAATTPEERAQSYAFLQPAYMTKIIERVTQANPQAIFDFDITEDGRCVGLQFLASGKYFIINNGPYYHNFDLAETWKTPLTNGNPNIFVQPGPARGWYVRSVLDYDKWLPSVLFLSHYQPDEPRPSQLINIGSLILGQNGIWGEILKTSEPGVQLFQNILAKYKTVRSDITRATLQLTGEPGGSPEIYEKIDPKTGKGCVVIFASHKGSYTYITHQKTDSQFWHTDGTTVKPDAQGRAVIQTSFTTPSAQIIFFGTK